MGSHNIKQHKELISLSKANNRTAQFRLYELYVDAMYSVIMRLVGQREEAEDLLQETFIDAFKNIKTFRFESTFGAWIKRIAVNKSINYLKLRTLDLQPLEYHQHHLVEEEKQEERPIELDIQQVKEAISRLPNGYKQIFSLYLMEGYSHKEIAEILNISQATSKSQYHRAKKKLNEIIKSLEWKT